MKSVTIYTDGACSNNPGPGGWAAVLMYGRHRKEISGNEPLTTNNRMEVTAAIKGMEALNQPCRVELYTDSSYLCNAFKLGWLNNWLHNGWRTAGKKPVENRDLWERMAELNDIHELVLHKVKGHADNEFNNRCDELARAEIKKLISNREQGPSGPDEPQSEAADTGLAELPQE